MAWNDPVKILEILDDETTFVEVGDAEPRFDTIVVLDKDSTERVRLGYVCLNCFNPHEQAFPEHCAVCTYPMKELQSRAFQEQFKGTKKMSKFSKAVYDRLEQLDLEAEMRGFSKDSSIAVPDSVFLKRPDEGTKRTDSGVVLPPGVKPDAS